MITAHGDHRNMMSSFTPPCKVNSNRQIEREEPRSQLQFLYLLPGEVQ
jgi:hypothetical protein